MTKEGIYQKLEKEYELIHDSYRYTEKFHIEDEGIEQIARFENLLLEGDVSYWVDLWDEDTKHAVNEYCAKRYLVTDNIHLKVKYGWGLWAISGKKDYQLLNTTIERILEIRNDGFTEIRNDGFTEFGIYGNGETCCWD